MLVEALRKTQSMVWLVLTQAHQSNGNLRVARYYQSYTHSLAALSNQAILNLFNQSYLDKTLLHACREFPAIAKLVVGNPEWKAHLPKEELTIPAT